MAETFFELSDFSLFQGVDTGALDRLVHEASNRLTAYPAGAIIAHRNASCRSLLLLCEGMVTTFMSNTEGKEVVIDRIQAPETLAPAFIYGSEQTFPVSVKAVTTCRVWAISKDYFLTFLQQDKVLLSNFLRLISDRSLFLSRKLQEFALEKLSTRLVSYLQQQESISNLQEVAFILGVARPSLSRALASMMAQGLVKKVDNKYVLVHP